MDNFMTLQIAAKSCNEAFARSVVAAFCVPLNPTVDQINDVKTAVSEAVTNSIVHAYDKGDGEIRIYASIEGSVLHIEVCDNGVGIENLEMARRPFFTTKPDDERSGMGFTVMESYMDSLEVTENEGGGVKVVMSKNLSMNNG